MNKFRLAISVLALANVCAAATVFTSVRVHPGLQSPDGPWEDFAISSSANDSSASGSSNFAGSTFSGSASALGDFGVLKSSAQAAITDYEGVNYYGTCPSQPSINCFINPAEATSSFGDTFTFGGGTGTGYLVIDFDITGSATWSSTPGLDAGAQGQLNIYKNAEIFGSVVSSTGFTGALNYSSSAIQFTYGSPIALNVQLVAFVWLLDDTLDASDTYSHTGNANYGSTAQVTGLRIFSDAGLTNQVFNATVGTSSGTDYGLAVGDAVPEPASVLALGSGLFAIVAFRKKISGRC